MDGYALLYNHLIPHRHSPYGMPIHFKLKIIHLQCLAHYHNPVNVDEFEDAYGVNSIAGS
jgi:hypothetical protein